LLKGIPPEMFEYRFRPAFEWVIDQYQVSADKRSGITHQPNRPDDPEYIVRLFGQVVTVSLETVKLVTGSPTLRANDYLWRCASRFTAGGDLQATCA